MALLFGGRGDAEGWYCFHEPVSKLASSFPHLAGCTWLWRPIRSCWPQWMRWTCPQTRLWGRVAASLRVRSWLALWSQPPPSLDQHLMFSSPNFTQLLFPNFPDRSFQSFLFPISRQHFLCDGVSRTIPGIISKVWWKVPAPLFPSWLGGNHTPLPQDVGAVLSEPWEPGGAGTGQPQDVERAGRAGWSTRAPSPHIFCSLSWSVRTTRN